MQYVLMSDGKGTRWNNYLGITKQEIIINNERLLDRTIRLITEKTDDKIYISSNNKNHESIYATRIVSKYTDYFHRKYVYEYINDETTFLYGDTFYTEKAIDIIINDIVENINFYGNESAIIGVKVCNYKLLKSVIDSINGENRSLYHAFDSLGDKRKFISVGDTFTNINNPEDYKKLILKLGGNNA